jgi:solute:Na+ symporter, SSS family
MKLIAIDWLVIIVYFLFLFGIGFYFSRFGKTAEQYFLADRKTKWYAIGPSMFAANISSEHFIGLAGSGAAAGLAVGAYEWVAPFCLFTLAWIFVPYYLKSQVFTMPEFLEKRYNPQCRWYLSSVTIVSYIFTKISISLFAGAILLKYVVGWNFLTSSILLVILTGIYTVAGGLAAVIYADMVQSTILILGSVVLTVIGLNKVGGFHELVQSLPPDFFQMIKPADHPLYPWTGTTLGIFIMGIWYWATDQAIVQKALSAKNLNQARIGIHFTALLKVLPVFILVLPGLIARALWPDELVLSPDKAYPLLITRLLPIGLSGLMISALLAALISSLASVFSSCSTLITMDFYRKIRPHSSEKQLVLAGRLFTGLIVALGIIWIPFISSMSNQLFQYLQAVNSYISPPIAAVFLVGILWKRATGKAAITTLIFGGIFGIVRFVLDILTKTYRIELYIFRPFVELAFLNYCVLMFFLCVAVMVFISFSTPKPDRAKVQSLTFQRQNVNEGLEPVWKWVHIGMTLIIASIIIGFWSYFA